MICRSAAHSQSVGYPNAVPVGRIPTSAASTKRRLDLLARCTKVRSMPRQRLRGEFTGGPVGPNWRIMMQIDLPGDAAQFIEGLVASDKTRLQLKRSQTGTIRCRPVATSVKTNSVRPVTSQYLRNDEPRTRLTQPVVKSLPALIFQHFRHRLLQAASARSTSSTSRKDDPTPVGSNRMIVGPIGLPTRNLRINGGKTAVFSSQPAPSPKS